MANQQEPVSYTTDQAAEALLARGGRLFGDDEPEKVEPEAPEAEEVEDAEEVETGDEIVAESDESSEVEPDESVSLETLDDVAKALGVDADQLMATLKMRVKVNGEESLISLQEAQKGTQLERDYRHKTAELAEQRRAIQAERDQSLAQLHQATLEAAAAVQWTEQAIQAELNNPWMAELRQTNPAEWVARQQEVQSKLGALHQARQQAQSQYAQAMQMQQAQQQRYLAAHLEEQASHLKAKVSDWSDNRREEVSKFLKDRYGYNDKEISGVIDHRLILMALDAQKGANAAKEAEKVIPKVKAAPKLQPPGKPRSPLQVKASQVAVLKGKLKQTGKLQDAARLLEARFK